MKGYVIIFCVVLACFCCCNRQQRDTMTIQLQSDESTRNELIEAVNKVNAACPVKASDHNILEGASFKDGKWTYMYSVVEDSIITFQNETVNKAVEANMKNATRDRILKTPSMVTMVEALIKVKADLVYQFKGDKTGTVITVAYTYPELRVMMDVVRNQK